MLNSSFGNAYLSISDRLTSKVPALKWIDQELGQLEISSAEYRYPVMFPCALIDMGAFQYTEIGLNAQMGGGLIELRLGYEPWANSNFKTALAQKEKALQYYEIEGQVVSVLHGWAPTGFTKLLRRSAVTEKREDTLRVRIITFETSLTDITTAKKFTTIPVKEPVIGGDIATPDFPVSAEL